MRYFVKKNIFTELAASYGACGKEEALLIKEDAEKVQLFLDNFEKELYFTELAAFKVLRAIDTYLHEIGTPRGFGKAPRWVDPLFRAMVRTKTSKILPLFRIEAKKLWKETGILISSMDAGDDSFRERIILRFQYAKYDSEYTQRGYTQKTIREAMLQYGANFPLPARR
jgi:hypothetical protein